MIIIRNANVLHMSVLGEQTLSKDNDYVLAKHCLEVNVNDGKLIFNFLTRALVYLENNEIVTCCDKYLFLYKTYFYVPKNFDSMRTIDNIRNRLMLPIDDFYLNHPTEFTILTTTKCNARCFYCYESDSKNKHHMSDEIAIKTAKYIESTETDDITLDWFGGEPLFNMKAINIITNYLKNKGKKFTSIMTSNGYLFSEDIIKKAKNDWNLFSVQITIDGTASVYNKTKNYIYKKDSNPYKTLMNNIKNLLDNDIKVIIRMNIDNYNIENVKKLLSDLYARFELNNNLKLYFWPIFEEGEYKRTEEENESLYKGLEKLESILYGYGYVYGDFVDENIKYFQCMADGGQHVTISPDGEIGVCEHYIDSKFFSNLDDPSQKDYKVLNSWRQYEPVLEECKDCPVYGSCLRPSECPEMKICNKYIKQWKIRKAQYGMLSLMNYGHS